MPFSGSVHERVSVLLSFVSTQFSTLSGVSIPTHVDTFAGSEWPKSFAVITVKMQLPVTGDVNFASVLCPGWVNPLVRMSSLSFT
jgi:hypothetical protein